MRINHNSALAESNTEVYARDHFVHLFESEKECGDEAAAEWGGQTDAHPVVLGSSWAPAGRVTALQIGAPMALSQFPYRVHGHNDDRETLAVQAHLVAAVAAGRLHAALPRKHRKIIAHAAREVSPEIPVGVVAEDALADIQDMVGLYADLFLPSCIADFVGQVGVDDGLAWEHPNVGVFFDMLVAGAVDAEAQILDPSLAADTIRFLKNGRRVYGHRFAGLRIVSVDSPDRSLKVSPTGDVYRLHATDLDPWNIEMAQATA